MRGRVFWVLPCVAALACMVSLAQGVATAQTGDGGWSQPVLLFKISDATDGAITVPVVVAGKDGSVHVFWQYQVPEAAGQPAHAAIYYTRWDGKSWSKPVDLVDAPTLHLSSAAIDRNGYLHLMWQGTLGRLFYARAREGDATSASKWTRPVPVDTAYVNGQIVADSRGWLHRVYARHGQLGTYYQVSKDGGATWSFPVNVARTSNEQSAADFVRVAATESGILHVVWTEFTLPSGWPPTGVYYSRSGDGGKTWSPPVELAGPGYDQINVAVAGDTTVHVAWNGMAGVGNRYHRWSSDGGRTWSAVSQVVTGGGGTEGPPQLAVDSAGNLHMLTTSDGRVWYDSWQGGGWAAPQYVPSGDEGPIPPLASPVDVKVRHIEQATMDIGLGNRLDAVFWDQRVQQGVTYVWYTTKTVGAPGLSPAAFPVPVPTGTTNRGSTSAGISFGPTRSLKTLPTAVRSVPVAADVPHDPLAGQPSPDSRLPAFAGSGLAVLLVGGVVLVGVVRGRNR